MEKVHQLLAMATDCYARARALSNPLAKAALNVIGDDYRKQAGELKRGRSVTQAKFPKHHHTRRIATHGENHHDNAESAS
jgi:hypothetical protein